LNHGFVAVKISQTYAFHKPTTATGQAAETAGASKRRRAVPRIGHPALPIAAPILSKCDAAPQRSPTRDCLPSLGEIRCIADRGNLADAARDCEKYISHGNPSADALHLLGLIHDASGDWGRAAELYRKALYLDPYYYESLVHLALLLQKNGDTAGAKLLDQRIRRLNHADTKQHV
jgi:chemotaxis protein methyltransferase WspC